MSNCSASSMMGTASLAVACLSVALSAQGAVTAPYTDSFATAPGGAGSNFSAVMDDPATTSTWTAVSGGVQNHFTESNWGVRSAGAVLAVDNLGGNNIQEFTVSATVKPVALGASDFYYATGLVVLSGTTDRLGGWGGPYYAAEISSHTDWSKLSFSLDIAKSDPANYPVGLASVPFPSFNVGSEYQMTLVGQYTSTGLNLAFTMTEVGNPAFVPVTVSYTEPNASMLGGLGNNFGIRNIAQGANVTMEYGNFSLANSVPEPASLGFLGVAVVGLMGRRRKLA